MAIHLLDDEPAVSSGVHILSDDEAAQIRAPESAPQSSFAQRFGQNLLNLPWETFDTARGLAQGTFRLDPNKARQMASNLGVRSAISKAVPLVASVEDFGAGVAQGAAELTGQQDWANDIEQGRKRSQDSVQRLDAWNAAMDEQAAVGTTWARRLRAADQSISESIGIGAAAGPKLASNALANYYAVSTTQDYLRDHPDAHPALAGVHGLIEGAATKLFMDTLRPTSAKLAGASEANVAPLYSRAVAKVKSRIGFDKSVDAIAGLGAEALEEVTIYNGHYWADVFAGVEKHDWTKYGDGLKETLIQTGLSAGAAEAGMSIANTMAKREAALAGVLDEEVTRREQRVGEEERILFIASEAQSLDTEPAGTAPQTTEQRLASLAMRERRLERHKSKNPKPIEPPGREPTLHPSVPSPSEVRADAEAKQADDAAQDARTGAISPAGAIEIELEQLGSMETELNQLRQDLLDDANVGSPRREQLTADIEEMQAGIAERLTQIAEMESATTDSPFAEPSTKTPAQRRLHTLQSQLGKAEAKTKAVRGQFKQDGIVRGELVNDAVEFVRDSLPPLERKGLELRAAKITTPAQLEKFLTAVDKQIAQYGKKLAQQRVSAALTKAKQYAASPKVAAKLDDITSPVDFGSQKGRNEIAALKQFIGEHPEADTPPGYADAIKRLDKVPAKDLTTAELNQLADAIDAVAGEVSTANTMFTMFQEMKVEELATKVQSEIAVNAPARLSFAGQATAEAGWAAANVGIRPENILSSLSESLRKLAWENIGVQAYRKYIRRKNAPITEMTKLLNGLGLSPMRSLGKVLKGGSALNEWRHETKRIGGTSMTRSEALHILGLMTDPQAAARLQQNGATLARTLHLKRLRLKPAHVAINDGTLREINDFIGEEGPRIVALASQQINGPMRDQVNDAWQQKYNVPLSDRIDYFPLKLDRDFVADNTGDAFAQFNDFVMESYGIVQRREGSEAPLQIDDFFNVYGRHADTVARVSSYLAPLHDFHSVIKRPDVKQAIVNTTSQIVYDGILEAVNQQTLPVHDPNIVSRAARRLTRGAGAAILGLRATTPYMSTTSIGIASQYLPNGEKLAAQSLARMTDVAQVNRMEQMLKKHSHYWTERYDDYIGEQTGGLAGVSGHFNPAPLREQAVMFHITTFDKFASIAKGFMAEAHVERSIPRTDPRFNEEVAMEWERLMYRSESTSNGLEATGGIRAGRRHGWMAPMFQFESGSSKDRSLLLKAGQDVRDGNYKAGAKASSAWAANRLFVAGIGAIFASLRGSDEEYSYRLNREIADQLPGPIGDIAGRMYRHARGLATYDGPISTLGEIIAETTGGLYALADAFYQYQIGDLDDEGDPKYAATVRRGMNKMVPIVAAISKVPIETALDTSNLAINYFGLGGDPEVEEGIKSTLRALDQADDISQPRARIWQAIQSDDDAAFLQGIAEIWQTDPARLNRQLFREIVNGKFEKLNKIERSGLQLTEPQQKWLAEQQRHRLQLFVSMQNMLARNAGQIDEITRQGDR